MLWPGLMQCLSAVYNITFLGHKVQIRLSLDDPIIYVGYFFLMLPVAVGPGTPE